MNNVADEIQDIGKIEVELQDIPKIARCGERGDYDPQIHEPCLTLGYSFIGADTDINSPDYKKYHDIMQIVAKNNDFEMGKDVRPLTAGKQKDIFNYV